MSAGKKSKSAKTKRSKGDSSKKTVDVATDALSRCNSLKPPPPAVVVDFDHHIVLCSNLWAAKIETKDGKDHRGAHRLVMVKRHKRKNNGFMRRASRVYLTEVNPGKVAALKTFDGQVIGAELRDEIKKQGKRSKTSRQYITTELFRHLKQ